MLGLPPSLCNVKHSRLPNKLLTDAHCYTQVEAGMAESIKESCKLGVAAYAAQAREQWVLEWPGQVVLAVSAIFWTSAVTNALKNGIPGQYSIICLCVLKLLAG